jgi:hypothetical protein
MANLIPTVITDRNGKVTTVHRRADASRAKAVSIPAPQVADEADPAVKDQIMGIVRSELMRVPSTLREEMLMEGMESKLSYRYPAEVLTAIRDTMFSHPTSRKTLSLLLSKSFDKVILHEAAVYLPEMWAGDEASAFNSVMALHDYEGRHLPLLANYALADSDARAKCIALINVTAALETCHTRMTGQPLRWRGTASIPVINDDALVKLIVENPDKAPLITQFIEERLSADVGALTELLRSDSSQLAEGAL